MTPSIKSSSNWFTSQKSSTQRGRPRKRRKIDRGESSVGLSEKASGNNLFVPPSQRDGQNEDIDLGTTEVKNGESIAALQTMVLGNAQYSTRSQTAPGKYLALDCEMVGVGIEGNESSLARVSIVNYAGAIILDAFVRQREKVVDYRTQWSGIRSNDLSESAKPFKEVQQTVAELIKDRILVGHAIYNDLKALLLSHPSPQIRNTQSLAYKHHVVKSRRPALRVLVKQELGVVIQDGEHSSVTDARATMALFRLHKKQWESGFRPFHAVAPSQTKCKVNNHPADKSPTSSRPFDARSRKRERSGSSMADDDNVDEVAETSFPGSRRRLPPSSGAPGTTPRTSTLPERSGSPSSVGPTQRKRISSGILSVTRRADGIKEVRRQGRRVSDGVANDNVRKGFKGGNKVGKVREKWWKTLEGTNKGSIKL